MILLRVVLIANLLASALSLKFNIDWNTCKHETQCFSLLECAGSTTKGKIEMFTGGTPLTDPKCPFIMQIRFLNNDKFLYILQLKKSLLNKTIEVFHGDESILSCREENGQIIANSTRNQMNPKTYEDLSYFDSDIAVCAFTVEKISTLALDIGKVSSVRFDQEKYEYNLAGIAIWSTVPNKIHCDPDLMHDLGRQMPEFDIRPVRYKAEMSLGCSNYKNELGVGYDYDLHIEQEDINSIIKTNLTCDSQKKLYTFNNGTNDFILEDSFTAFCAVHLSKTCNTTIKCTGTVCPTITAAFGDKDPELNCPGGKWILDDVYYEKLKPVCKLNSKNVPGFSVTLPDNSEQELTTGQCFKEYNCKAHGKFDISSCNTDDCSNVLIGENLHCENATHNLIIFSGKEVRNDTQKFTCDPQDGFYKSTTDPSVTIPINSRIACTMEKEKEEAKISAAHAVGLPVLAGLGSIVIVGAVTALIYFLVFKRKHIKGDIINMKRRDAWKQMSRDSKILEAKEVFGKALEARLDQEVTILQGLKLMDTILECETEEPDVWDHIYPFIKRLQTVAYFKAYKLEKMFNRYCYLQARKIIDKHGWISKNKITKSNHAGYIRVCAIQLLHLARRDDIDAQRMVLEGFKKLRFNGFDQYPHCGLLWAVLTQQRVGVAMLQSDFVRNLYQMYFDADDVKNAFKDIPEEDQFTQFGSLKDQMAFAIGAAEASVFSIGKNLLEKLSDSFIRHLYDGIMYPTSGNTAATMLHKDAVARFYKLIFAEPILVKQTINTLIFQRRIRDAKNMWKSYKGLLEGQNAKSEDLCIAAKTSYQNFVDSLESENKSLIAWLSRSNSNEQREKIDRNIGAEEKTPKSNSAQIKPESGSKKETQNSFVDKFVDAFGKEEPAKKITTLTATEETKLREMLQLLLSIKTLNGERAFFPIGDVIDVLNKAREIFESEPVFMEDVPAGITVVGDIHGQLYDLARIFDANAKDGKPGYEAAKYLFLGDFVDRGPQILEVVMTLFILKILYPDRFFLLRGNHEFVSQNHNHQTYREIEERYHVFPAEFLYHKLNECLAYMPICAVIGGEIFCVHGGVSASTVTRQELRALRKPVYSTEHDSIINDLLWADPHKGMQGFKYNPGRGTAINYSEEFLQHALERLDCSSLIRGHQVLKNGYDIVFPNCLSLFSATAVDDHILNDAAFVRISENLKYQIVKLKIDNIREEATVATYGKKEDDEVSCRDSGVGIGSGEIDDYPDDDD